ncbi:ATP-binding cassette domain-containing protein [Ligilactobacillus salivarius]|uniref:ATP-binding cassette domain-containing protein n=1 Tax=Ligilactobacillus salivarius TaxID=1624 RepID=A0ABD7YUE2_9LACO|nr:ATP-binding cassette domain-containing protein [Ligilactobacillus salivarius]WHS05813.1 ATP-binding cassette domain-containing protein [Ligilactobacillus salivarius]WHS08109.1 ATP-binding cassette domain-containing protein [Ligilactobacillus salivarius]WHS09726.1 ATP-binding cassette domain-containing protein [Ligilactobacillus salivarius]WHS13665.1 ATP-binding cassette domain-containing protein [Ligilactobacillus salivarius]WHS17720.1 ATP-binding cassette domain-containing protein [Ligilac
MAILSLQNVGYKVDTSEILKNINLDINENEFITITGPSGGGKSTLLKIIATLLTATTGEIFFDGKNQDEYAITEYRQQVSYCFQQPSLFGETVFDNLSFPYEIRQKEFDEKSAIEALKSVNLPETYLHKDINSLSGGERQRVALLRNTMFLPKVLLLDEVTVGLDARSIEIVHEFIDKIWKQGVTILQITHHEREIKQANKIIWVEEGMIKDVTTKR